MKRKTIKQNGTISVLVLQNEIEHFKNMIKEINEIYDNIFGKIETIKIESFDKNKNKLILTNNKDIFFLKILYENRLEEGGMIYEVNLVLFEIIGIIYDNFKFLKGYKLK